MLQAIGLQSREALFGWQAFDVNNGGGLQREIGGLLQQNVKTDYYVPIIYKLQ